MTKEQLIKKSTYKAVFIFGTDFAGRAKLLTELEHYFDADMNEIGMTYFYNNMVTVFDPVRVWDKSLFSSYRITRT
jgi:hypothetical protein